MMIPMYSFAVTATTRVTNTWPWYLTRASGVVAAVLLVLLIITGIAMYTGLEFTILEPIKAWTNHRTLGIAMLVAVAVHVGSLLFDKFISFNIWQVLLPFVSPYKRVHLFGISVGSFGVMLGIVAFYLVLAIMVTSRVRMMAKHKELWRLTHLLSYAVILVIFFHSIMIGSDLKNGLWRWLWIGANVIVLGFISYRLSRVGSLD